MEAAANRMLMFGIEGETEIDRVPETGSEAELVLVLSKEDTTEGVTRQEVLECWTDAMEGSETDTGTGRSTIQSWKVTLCCT